MILQLGLSVGDVVPILGALGTGIIGSVAGYEYRKFRERQQKRKTAIEDWFDECQNLASRGNQTVYRASLRSDIGYEAILNDLDSFAERLFVKARNHPDEIPTEVADRVANLSRVYSKATSVAEVNTQKEGIEVTAELFEMAQQEFPEDVDAIDMLNAAGDVSGEFRQLLMMVKKQGVERAEFAEVIEKMFSEWESEDFAYLLASSSQSNADIDATVQQTMRMFLGIVNEVSDSTYECLQEQKKSIL